MHHQETIPARLAVIAYPIGRIGSSAIMGLLSVSGWNIGRETALIPAAAMNPKGFFELKSQQQLLCEAYPDHYPAVVAPPTPAEADEIGAVYAARYHRLLQDEFSVNLPAAVKSPRCLTLPFLHRLREHYSVRIVLLERNEDDQVRSILRVWRTLDDPVRSRADAGFVRDWIDRWRRFGTEYIRRHEFPCLPLSFDRLLAAPEPTVREISRFLDMPAPPARAVAEWIDASLVNRESVGTTSIRQ